MLANTQRLLGLMEQLRHPEQGCPWDIKQNFSSLIPYLVEETYEVIDAIERNDADELRLELGDLLLQVVFHAQIANEMGLFDFEQVAAGISDKLVRRHPHVFLMPYSPTMKNGIMLGNRSSWKSAKKRYPMDLSVCWPVSQPRCLP